MKYKVAIVGLGKIALGFDLNSTENNTFSHAKAFMNDESFELVCGVDCNFDRRTEFEFFSEKKAFSTIDEACKFCNNIDVVSICTPTDIRMAVLGDILKFKPKIILLEKPIAYTMLEAIEIKNIIAEHGAKVFVNYMRRVEPYFASLKDIFSFSDASPSKIVVHYTGGLFANASHFINLMIFNFGKPDFITVLDKKPLEKDYSSDFVMTYGKFKVFFVSHTNTEYSIGEIDIVCNNRRYLIYDWGFKVKTFESSVDLSFPELKKLKESKMQPTTNLKHYMKHSVEYVARMLENDNLDGGLYDAIATTEICEYIKNAI